MNTKYSIILLSGIAANLLLSACTVEESNASEAANAVPNVVNVNNYNQAQHYHLYPKHRETQSVHYNDTHTSAKEVIVPESYHLTHAGGPATHSERDRNWVKEQNPQEYTIELSNSDKAASVATVLQQVPKKERTAEIKSNKDGKTSYHGLYGSYKDKESAEKALQNLPEKVKAQANIEQWDHLQDKTLEKSSIPAADNNSNTTGNS